MSESSVTARERRLSNAARTWRELEWRAMRTDSGAARSRPRSSPTMPARPWRRSPRSSGSPSSSASRPTRTRSVPRRAWWRRSRREAAASTSTPTGAATALREALGHRSACRAEQIVVGNGADELIALIALAAFEPGDEVVLPHPSFEPYDDRWPSSAGAARRPKPAGWLRDRPRRRAAPDHAAHQGGLRLLAAQPGDDHHSAGGPRRLPRLRSAPIRRSSSSTRRTGTSATIPSIPDGVALLAQLPAAGHRCARSPRSPRWPAFAWAMRWRSAETHRPPQPRARALQRQPARPGRRPGRARGRGPLEQEPAGGHRGARLPLAQSWPAAGSPSRRRRRTSCS